ncbi:potassium transporter Kup [Lichenihabitans psoromatis]|uniref:potassium transporter Kup n=1 Tax=Lichenihabitans psoromatis TaxID=2528642 RepID=UPI0010384075|nr:potassium transporter Kup [Lichenihabitans psoromatis]
MPQDTVQDLPVAEAARPVVHDHGHPVGGFPMILGSIGVVYGDIGTSPLYALKTALAHASSTGATVEEVVGIVSLLIYALFFTVTVKYVLFLMRADNKGEGGTLSLMALAQKALGHRAQTVFLLGVAGAALFSGDAIITPAISVLSAVEGLGIAEQGLIPYVIPITVVILISLFTVQSFGTAKVAAFFGPIMVVFFSVIGAMGLVHIFDAPIILTAFNPLNGLAFLFGNGATGFVTLGLVFLAVTGAEALYADMGHFGRMPIQLAWLFFVLPALLLNYLGQGALVLRYPETITQPFFLMVPNWALIPLVILSTVATVIASQAVITGAYSLIRQAIQLGLLPRMEIQHTSETTEGQIYVPRANRLMLIGVLVLVFLFKSSDNLANAYGIAVTGTMVVTTSLSFFVVWKLWRWPLYWAVPFVAFFLVIDLAFLFANMVKVLDGGWVPLLMAACSMLLMWTWVRGTAFLSEKTHRDSISTRDLIRMLQKSKPIRVPGTAIFLTSDPEVAPSALMHNLKHNKVIHERVIILSVKTADQPRVAQANRYQLEKLSDDFTKIILNYGYMEHPRMPSALASLKKAGLRFDIMTTSYFLGRRSLKASPNSGMPVWQDRLYIALSKQAATAPDFFSIPSDRVVELGAQVTI